ncbi:MAG: zf-HC2 domain-containing protein [Chloroflexota bacterium]|nr:zf-HC2 domain-containing protein [Chloroflexota bacterium]
MGIAHLSSDELSALLDGELGGQAELRARSHLGECASCSAEYAEGVRLDDALRQPPAFTCDELVDLVSASVDGETNGAEGALVQRHLAHCESCTERAQDWAPIASQIRALPRLAPSARIDNAIDTLLQGPRIRLNPRGPGMALRASVAVAAVVTLIMLALVPPRQAPTITEAPSVGEPVLVAGVQQMVLNPRNNTLYVLDREGAAVDARDPSTNDRRSRILVGGRPIALALNESANTILVLDAGQKRVTEIDAVSNTVVSTTTVAFAGTPTSISVGPSSTQILVGTKSAGDVNATTGGGLAVLDGSTKRLETVRDINVAPALVVPDQQSGRTALVSGQATTVVDSSFNVIATLNGGVSATFSRRGDNVAILAAAASDSVVTFAGTKAPVALQLRGAPRAITSHPDGGYLVLVAINGGSRVSKISADGAVVGSVELPVTGGDLVYDDKSNLFAIANAGRVDVGQVPTEIGLVASAPSASPSPAPSSAPTLTATPSGSPSSSPAVPAVPSVGASPAATATPSLVARATAISPGLYSYPMPRGLEPELVAARGSRLWFVDGRNSVDVFDMNTGDVFSLAKLAANAHVSYLAAGSAYVFTVDTTSAQIDVVSVAQERVVQTYPMAALGGVVAVAVGPDDRLWLGLRSAMFLLALDPKTGRIDSFDLAGARVAALTVDKNGAVIYADDFRGTVGRYDPVTRQLYEVSFRKRGTTTSLASDSDGTLWVGTTTGEIYTARGANVSLALSLQRPVTTLVTDQQGHAWYLAPAPPGAAGYAFGRADGSQAARAVPGPAVGLAFNTSGRAFLGDPRGAIYLSLEADSR